MKQKIYQQSQQKYFLTGMGNEMLFDIGYTSGPIEMLSKDFTLSGYQETKISFDNFTDENLYVIRMI